MSDREACLESLDFALSPCAESLRPNIVFFLIDKRVKKSCLCWTDISSDVGYSKLCNERMCVVLNDRSDSKS